MKPQWVRIVLALIIGGAFQEIVRIVTGKDVGWFFLVGAVISYILISAIVYYRNVVTLQRKIDNELKQNNELIDDFK